MWDRSKQNYWIVRRGNPWEVRNFKTNEYVYDYPAHLYDDELMESVCFAESDEQVKSIINGYRTPS